MKWTAISAEAVSTCGKKLLERLNEHYLHQTARRSCAYTQVMGSDLSKNLESCNQDM